MITFFDKLISDQHMNTLFQGQISQKVELVENSKVYVENEFFYRIQNENLAQSLVKLLLLNFFDERQMCRVNFQILKKNHPQIMNAIICNLKNIFT